MVADMRCMRSTWLPTWAKTTTLVCWDRQRARGTKICGTVGGRHKRNCLRRIRERDWSGSRQEYNFRLWSMNTQEIDRFLSRCLSEFGEVFSIDTFPENPRMLVCNTDPSHEPGRHGLDWIVQCFTSPPTQYRLYGRRFLQVKRPSQQYQSTEGSYKGKQHKEQRKHKIHMPRHTKK